MITLILSLCVQMSSLNSIQAAEDKFGVPAFSPATATTDEILDTLGLSTQVPGAGRLLSATSTPVPAESRWISDREIAMRSIGSRHW